MGSKLLAAEACTAHQKSSNVNQQCSGDGDVDEDDASG